MDTRAPLSEPDAANPAPRAQRPHLLGAAPAVTSGEAWASVSRNALAVRIAPGR
jgi:hypothetical protein